MSIVISTQNEQEERVLIAFLDSKAISYKTSVETDLASYNHELERADAKIDEGDFLSHSEVVLLINTRNKK